jgi:hypothetical protein
MGSREGKKLIGGVVKNAHTFTYFVVGIKENDELDL